MERINTFFEEISELGTMKNPYLSLLKNKKIVVYGAGALGHEIYKNLLKKNIEIDCFCSGINGGYIDKNTGIPVIKKEELSRYLNAIIIMAIGDAATTKEKENLVFEFYKMGFLDVQILNHSLFDKKERCEDILQYREHFAQAYQLLEDDISKKVYIDKLEYLVKYIPVGFKSDKDMYLDSDLIQLTDNECIIDAGAFTGDTAELFVKNAGKGSNIYSFEPDESNYKKLWKRVKDIPQIKTIKKGLWSKSTTLSFSDDQNGSSHIKESGDIEIEAIDLDSFCDENNLSPTFIKMDIEGAEFEAINGSRKTIIQNKPRMSICLYHKLEDMFMIPIMIKELDADYKLYVRHYSDYHTDTVLYAVR